MYDSSHSVIKDVPGHPCRPPNDPVTLRRYAPGTVLRCDACGQLWERKGFPSLFAWGELEAGT